MPFPEIAIVTMGAAVLGLWLGRSRFEMRLAARIRSWSALSCLGESAGIMLISQFLTLGSFVVGIQAVQPGIDITLLFAAAAVISFAASIPVTVNGWGIREVTAVYVLGRLGISGTVGRCASEWRICSMSSDRTAKALFPRTRFGFNGRSMCRQSEAGNVL